MEFNQYYQQTHLMSIKVIVFNREHMKFLFLKYYFISLEFQRFSQILKNKAAK